MIRKLALSLLAAAAFASPALAAQKGVPDYVRCTHCLPSAQAGGAPTVAKGRLVRAEAGAAPIGAAAGRPAVARKYAPAATAAASETVAVEAACGCARGACPTHG